MGLVASVVAKWKPNKKFSYGFGRVEVLSGYVNSLFLMVIGCMLVKEAIYRLVAPPEVHTHHLLSVSIIGLIVNVIGLASFSQGVSEFLEIILQSGRGSQKENSPFGRRRSSRLKLHQSVLKHISSIFVDIFY